MPLRVFMEPREQLQGGGVNRVANELAKRMPTLFPVEYVSTPAGADITHYHALATGPRIDVYQNHGIWPNERAQPDNVKTLNTVLTRNIVAAGVVISVAQWAADQYAQDLGVKARVIPNGVDLAEFDAVPRGRFRPTVGAVDKPLFLWGKTHLAEDAWIVLELARAHPEWIFATTLLPPGAMPLPNIRMVGTLPYDRMKEAIVDCDVMLSSSRENCPLQVLEAMAARKPVLGWNHGGNREVILHKTSGYLYDGDWLHGAEECLKHAAQWGERGRKRAQEVYNWSIILPQIWQAYQDAYAIRQQRSQSPRVSFVIPCYKYERYVGEAIDSALSSSFPDFEVIVVDDGSPDNSFAVAKQKEQQYPGKVRAIQQKNAGVSAARNRGIQEARGEIICCLDADDKVSHQYLSRLLPELQDDRVGLVYSGISSFTDAAPRPRAGGGEPPSGMERLVAGNHVYTCCLFRKEAWRRTGGFKSDQTANWAWEDYALWLDIMAHGYEVRFVSDPMYYYRTHTGGRVERAIGKEMQLRRDLRKYLPGLFEGRWGYGANANAAKQPPDVSVVIPCYNHAQYIMDAISSVYVQTYPWWEIIVVDDASPDNLQQVLAPITDYRVKVVRHDTNRGLAEARNTGVRAASGKAILPLDADDMLEPNAIAAMWDRLTKEQFRSWVYSDLMYFGYGYPEPQIFKAPEFEFLKFIHNSVSSCTVMYPKEAWSKAGGYKDIMSKTGGWEDYEFAITMAEQGYCGVHLPLPLLWYRQHERSMRTEAQAHHVDALRQIMHGLHADVYNGRLPVGCCGGNRMRYADNGAGPAPKLGDVPFVIMQFLGNQDGARTFAGPVTYQNYRFSASESKKWVDGRDAAALVAKHPFLFAIVPE